MKELSQERAPIYEALERFNKMRVVPFDVPGHKRGRGNPELTRLLGESCIRLDVNSMKPLDNLCHPVSVIREAEAPVFPEEPGKELLLQILEKKGLISLDYDKPLKDYHTPAYDASPVRGSMALTKRGQDVLELMEYQGVRS